MTDAEKTRLTESGLAARFLEAHGEDFRYCELLRTWFGWTGTHWQADPAGQIQRAIEQTLREAREAAAPEDARHFDRAESKSGRDNILALARHRAKRIEPADMDADPLLLNCTNGTLDLRTGQLRPHSRDDVLTRVAGTEWQPTATVCPKWEIFLLRVCDGDLELLRYLQRCIGYSLTGDVREQIIFLLWGEGANGKSTFLLTLLSLLGSYAQPADLTLVTRAAADDGHLFRSRLVVLPETPEGHRLHEARVKALTGGDRVITRDRRSFSPTHKLWMATNHLPEIRGTDHATWRRLCPIPFKVRIEAREQDKDLLRKLASELPGILVWAVEGCQAWLKDGLKPPNAVRRAADRYRTQQDRVGAFIAECCVIDDDKYLLASVLYERYATWAEENAEPLLGPVPFGRRLAQLGFRPVKMNAGTRRAWGGLDLPPLRDDEMRPMAYGKAIPEEQEERALSGPLREVWKARDPDRIGPGEAPRDPAP